MMKKIVILIALLLVRPSIAADFIKIEDYTPISVPKSVKVSASKNTYLVSEIEVAGAAESDSQAFDNALYDAKFIAFRALKNTLQDSILPEDPTIIDAAMSGFVPSGGHFEDGVYKAKFDILFAKDKIASLITERKMVGQQLARAGEDSVVARAAIKNNIESWVKIRSRLDASKIKYKVISLSLNEVELIFKNVNVDKLTEDLKEAELNLVANRNFYFISLPLFS